MKILEFFCANYTLCLWAGIALMATGILLFMYFPARDEYLVEGRKAPKLLPYRISYFILAVFSFFWVIEVVFAHRCCINYYPRILKMLLALNEISGILAFCASLIISAAAIFIFLTVAAYPAIRFWKILKKKG